MKVIKGSKNKSVLGKGAEKRKEEVIKILEETSKKQMKFSASKIQTFLTCPLKYKFKYVDKIKKQLTAPALAMGISFHTAMEYIYECIGNGIKPDKEIINQTIEETMDRKLCSYMDDTEWYEFVEEAKKIVNYYNDHKRKFKPLIVDGNVCSEVSFEVPVKDPVTGEPLEGVTLRGSMDLITEDLKIVDFKTAGKIYSDSKVETAIQLTAYSYAFREMFKQTEEKLCFDVVVKRRKTRSNPEGKPDLKNFYTARDKNNFIVMFNIIKQIIKAEEHGCFFPTYPGEGSWCKNCEYATECSNWKGDM